MINYMFKYKITYNFQKFISLKFENRSILTNSLSKVALMIQAPMYKKM